MKTDKWLYFRTVSDVDQDDGSLSNYDSSMMIPASKLIGMIPVSDDKLRLEFEPVKYMSSHNSRYQRSHAPYADSVTLNLKVDNTHKEVMELISSAINSPSRDTFIVIADDVTVEADESTHAAEYIAPGIESVQNLAFHNTPQGYGIHEYFENVIPTAADNNDVAVSLSVKLPVHCIILEAAITNVVKATSNHGLCALEIHSAAIANDAASDGTEIVGADATNNLSIPDANLDFSNDAVLNDTVHSGTFVPVDRGAAETFFHITAKEDQSSMTGEPLIGVYVKWFGSPAEPLTTL